MGMVLDHPSRTAPPRANRQHPERDTAVRWRAVPADAVAKGEGGLLLVPRHFMYDSDGKQLDSSLVASLIQRISTLEREVSVLLGRGAPVEKSDRPMTPTTKEQVSTASPVILPVPGNEAEVLPISDVTPAPAVKIAGLLPAPSLVAVAPPVQPAANSGEETEDYAAWLRSQFGWSDMEMFRVLDREYHRRNEACLKTHKMTYTDLRISRLMKKKGCVQLRDNDGEFVPGTNAYFAAPSGIKEWEAHRSGKPTQLSVRAFLGKYEGDAHRAWKRGMATTPEAYRVRAQRATNTRKLDIAARLGGVRFMHELRYAEVEATAVALEPNLAKLRTSESQIKSWMLKARDVTDRVRRVVGLPIPDRGAKWREDVGDGSAVIPHPANHFIEEALKGDDVPMRELVRGYQRKGIGF